MDVHYSALRAIRPVEVKSGPFQYVNYKYGTCGLQVNGIDRSSSERLMYLLTYVDPGPVLTKRGKPRVRQPPPHKDETGKFYEAQLIHYGLKPRKDKQAAKKALLEAAEANGGKFVVPEDILKLEGRMAEEYRIKDQERDKKVNEIRKRQKEAEEMARKKRKREEDALFEAVFGPSSSTKKVKHNETPKSIRLASLPGEYTIVAPKISDGWGSIVDAPLTLQLALSSTGSRVWGAFNFGPFEGTLRSHTLDRDSFDGTLKFHWRGRETGEHESTFGSENIAQFTFFNDIMFRGTMFWDCCGKFELAGKKDEDMSRDRVFSKNIPGWKTKYRELNEDNYDAECKGRWGGWRRYPHPDKPAESDTTVGDDEDDEEETDDY